MPKLKLEKDLRYLYVADKLAEWYPSVYEQLKEIVGDNLKVIPGCKDVWARDFMPLNGCDGSLISFDYNPDYLLRKHEDEYRTSQKELLYDVKLYNGRQLTYGQGKEERAVVLDGGNVVSCGDKVIVCDKIVLENDALESRGDFKARLEKQLGSEVVFVPWDYTEEPFGHADGYAVYLGGNRVMMNNSAQSNPEYAARLKSSLVDAGFEVVEFCLKNRSFNDWVYINYVQWGDLILVPALGLKDDEEAQQFISKATGLPLGKIKLVKMPKSLIEMGGALHCCTWNSDCEINEVK